jgi:RNA polymerase sigma factor (sigma-70 family)
MGRGCRLCVLEQLRSVSVRNDAGKHVWFRSAMTYRQIPRRCRSRARDDAPTLVRRAQSGDDDALVELIHAYRPFVAATAHQYLVDSHDVDDAIQEVWIALVNDIDRIQSPDRVIGWLRRVTINAALRTRKRAAGRGLDSALGGIASESAEETGLANIMRDETRRSVENALGRLRGSDRELLTMIAATDHPDYRSISEKTGRPVGSIGPTRQRALARLRSDPELAAL